MSLIKPGLRFGDKGSVWNQIAPLPPSFCLPMLMLKCLGKGTIKNPSSFDYI